jgi:hypothetical protein
LRLFGGRYRASASHPVRVKMEKSVLTDMVVTAKSGAPPISLAIT